VFALFGVAKFTAHATELGKFCGCGPPDPDAFAAAVGTLEIAGAAMLAAGLVTRHQRSHRVNDAPARAARAGRTTWSTLSGGEAATIRLASPSGSRVPCQPAIVSAHSGTLSQLSVTVNRCSCSIEYTRASTVWATSASSASTLATSAPPCGRLLADTRSHEHVLAFRALASTNAGLDPRIATHLPNAGPERLLGRHGTRPV
jgi:hypothetical protein